MARRKLVQWCKRLEPKVARQFERPWLRWAGPWLTRHDALAFRRRPLAVGVAVGMLSGLIPGPAKAVVALLLCSMLRGNAIAAVATTFYINPLTIVPAYLLAYRLGLFLLPGATPTALSPTIDLTSVEGMMALGPWILDMGWPLLLGLFVMGFWLAANAYWLVNYLWLRPVVARAKRIRAGRSHRASVDSNS
jgi:uncharacterized protein